MALEDNDLIRDNGIQRGIGTSPLISQRLQRKNIEELRSLRSAVGQSQATLENERRKQLHDAQKAYLESQKNALNPRAQQDTTGMFDPSKPSFFIQNNSAGPNQSYQVLADGRFINPKGFSSLAEAQEYIRTQGFGENANVVFGGLGDGLTAQELQQFKNSGGINLPLDQARKLTGRSQSGQAGNIAFGDGGRGRFKQQEAPQPTKDELAKLGTPKAADLDFSKIDRNTQAKLFDQELTRFNSIAKTVPVLSSIEDFNNLSPEQQIAIAISNEPTLTGKFKAFQSAARLGIVRGR